MSVRHCFDVDEWILIWFELLVLILTVRALQKLKLRQNSSAYNLVSWNSMDRFRSLDCRVAIQYSTVVLSEQVPPQQVNLSLCKTAIGASITLLRKEVGSAYRTIISICLRVLLRQLRHWRGPFADVFWPFSSLSTATSVVSWCWCTLYSLAILVHTVVYSCVVCYYPEIPYRHSVVVM